VLLLQAFLQAAMGLRMPQASGQILQHQQQMQAQQRMVPHMLTAAILQDATSGG
jgi:hypothetical protein